MLSYLTHEHMIKMINMSNKTHDLLECILKKYLA